MLPKIQIDEIDYALYHNTWSAKWKYERKNFSDYLTEEKMPEKWIYTGDLESLENYGPSA